MTHNVRPLNPAMSTEESTMQTASALDAIRCEIAPGLSLTEPTTLDCC